MKSKIGIALLAILIFLLGGVAGGVSLYLYCEHIKASSATIPKVDDVAEWMARELKLDAQQKAAVKVIIIEMRGRYHALSLEFRPRYEQLRKESDDRINALLREDQKPLFDKFLKKIKAMMPVAAQPASSNK
jgi:hypothetical protein